MRRSAPSTRAKRPPIAKKTGSNPGSTYDDPLLFSPPIETGSAHPNTYFFLRRRCAALVQYPRWGRKLARGEKTGLESGHPAHESSATTFPVHGRLDVDPPADPLGENAPVPSVTRPFFLESRDDPKPLKIIFLERIPETVKPIISVRRTGVVCRGSPPVFPIC